MEEVNSSPQTSTASDVKPVRNSYSKEELKKLKYENEQAILRQKGYSGATLQFKLSEYKSSPNSNKEYDDVIVWEIDQNVIDGIKKIVTEAANKYKITLGDWLDLFCDVVYRDFFADLSGYKRMYRDANTLLQFYKLRDSVTVKETKYTTNLYVDESLLAHIKERLRPDVEKVLNWGTLIGYDEDEKYKRIEELAEREELKEKKHFRMRLNDYIVFFKKYGIFSTKPKTIRNKDASFLFDIIYRLKDELKAGLPIKWGENGKDDLGRSNNDKQDNIESLMYEEDLPFID